ncbi:MAG: alpha/beta fold hydrolase [Chloroflexi bacterium]|nr:alpha/beta fold hydrolase [Chloroflexota bacterium]
MKKFCALLLLLAALTQACAGGLPTLTDETGATAGNASAASETSTLLKKLGGEPCPDSDFTCVTLEVPLDHFHPDGRTIKVVFGVLPATGQRKGVFVNATGGPGTSGLLSADDYAAAFDPSIPENFDIVFFDQRGVGLSGGLQCANAAAAFYRANWDASTPDGEAALTQSAKTFAEDCVAEMGAPESLPYLGTAQAVEDLDDFLDALGVDKFWLYGESYGTQYAQTYAASHPDRLAGLLLDGTVDLTRSGFDFYVSQAQAFNDSLAVTLAACNEDDLCSADMNGDAIAAYDALAARLKISPLPFEFPLPTGEKETRGFTFSDLETTASAYMYSETARMIFLRALASYARTGDLIPMARILYDALGLDPETLAAIPDPSFSDAIYYAVECQDYGYPGATPEQRAEIYLRAGDAYDDSLPRFSSIFYGDLPCAFWPNATENTERPAPLVATGIPTIVLNGTADPATPYEGARAVHSRLEDGYFVGETGGPHVIFGWGNSCVDDLVTAFLVADLLPAHEVTCDGVVVSEYVPLLPVNAADFENPLHALAALDDEIYYLPEYYYWDYETPTAIGCPFGGTFSFVMTDEGEKFSFFQCAFLDGFALTGDGLYSYDDESLTLHLSIRGLANGALNYQRNADGNISVTGTYNGVDVDLSE